MPIHLLLQNLVLIKPEGTAQKTGDGENKKIVSFFDNLFLFLSRQNKADFMPSDR
jgi:hypothetical protein